MFAQTETAERVYAAPVRSPINTKVELLAGAMLSDRALRANVLITGDLGSGRSAHAKMIVEDLLAREEQDTRPIQNKQVIVVDRGLTWQGISRMREGVAGTPVNMAVFGKSAAFTLQPDDGEGFGEIAVRTESNMLFDVAHMNHKQVARFLRGLLEKLTTEELADKHIVVVLEDLDALIPRRRHGGDSQAVKEMLQLLINGGRRNISVIATALSAQAIPIECAENMTTVIACRTTSPRRVYALTQVTDRRVGKYQDAFGFGINVALDHQHWLWNHVDNPLDLPNYFPLRQLLTAAGDPTGTPKPLTSETADEIIAEVLAGRKDEEPKPSGKTTTKPEKVAKPAKPEKRKGKGKTKASVSNGSIAEGQLKAMGVVDYVARAQIGRSLVRLEAGQDMFPGRGLSRENHVAADALVRKVLLDDDIAGSARATARFKKGISNLLGASLIGVAHYHMAKDDAGLADSFFKKLIGRDEEPSAAIQALLGKLARTSLAKAPASSTPRYTMVMAAWADYRVEQSANIVAIGTKRAVANDDAARAKAA